jgi:Ni/Fe-hydrogenase subunit HybB-like protein
MTTTPSIPPVPSGPVPGASHLVAYPRFLWSALKASTDGSPAFYAWMTALTAVALVGANAWAHQVAEGMAITGMTDHVSWGLYIANFTFSVGLAAGAVMMVIFAYLYDDQDMRAVVIVGEILAIAAILMSLLFVVVDMGRPDRFWHIVPGIGRFNWPISMLTWDVVVLNGYLLLNLHIVGYLLYMRYLGRPPSKRVYMPFVFVSIGWAISIHTVTAFLYSGLGGRPFWNSALLAPRFIASAFVSGPAFVIVLMQLVRRLSPWAIGDGPIWTLGGVLRITVLINLFMVGSELFTALYAGGAHAAAVQYLFFGLHGHAALVPWIWTAMALNVAAAGLLLTPRFGRQMRWLTVACVLAFVGVWIEKGMGLIVPGFVPSTLHEMVEYRPSLAEWKVTAGVWALGMLVLTVGMKVLLRVLEAPAARKG